MKLQWKISAKELERWRSLVEENKANIFVKVRERRNVSRKNVVLSKNALWRAHVMCQVTTQQRSGPGSLVSKFLDSNSGALKYGDCAKSSDLESLFETQLSAAKLRRINIITRQLCEVFRGLENGGWDDLIKQLKTIRKCTNQHNEREVARYIEKKFKGPLCVNLTPYTSCLG